LILRRWRGGGVLAAVVLLGACERAQDVHATTEARAAPCVSCHQAAFAHAANPPHDGVLPTTCESCHNTMEWTPATVTNHPWYPLDGRHRATACSGCHGGSPPRYAGTPQDCVTCHLADYQNSTYPVHDTLPQTCPDCHTTAGFKPATGGYHPEAVFPIQTGSHSNPAIGCNDCHRSSLGSPLGGQNTDCIHCHLGSHNRPAIDAVHTAFGAAYPGPDPSSANFCRSCHQAG
jgi:hypothetical protein